MIKRLNDFMAKHLKINHKWNPLVIRAIVDDFNRNNDDYLIVMVPVVKNKKLLQPITLN